ncbi:hypothetical protein K431DRAFT_231701 [Polychaeton citri CBS 116435]|uniref:Zn(2)-C6 fungal-type domain-containing protein n=1 Tax=Polychaeton citri CBS 116435 TaxID=1314669 RepID=A0A9P4UL26_9PEZI|nr:hypothetical protein K431DRAFT_231701 [Polychaeton citri CBS 116435]
MTDQPPSKRVRRGAKSCVECRHRKVRCVWPSEQADVCQNCLARGRPCQVQTHMITTSEVVNLRSRDRIHHLEDTVANLWKVVRGLEAKLEDVPSKPVEHAVQTPPYTVPPVEIDDGLSTSELSEVSPSDPPAHLLRLFDNNLLAHHEAKTQPTTSALHSEGQHWPAKVSALRAFLPSRPDMLTICAQASSWLYMYNSLFPMLNIMQTSEEMLVQYDRLQQFRDADVTDIAALLLSIAITVQQTPQNVTCSSIRSTNNASAYIQKISDAINRIVISDDTILSTFKGIETALLYLRLDLGFARVKKMWLLLHRIIAVAEIMGLPQAAMSGIHQEKIPIPQNEPFDSNHHGRDDQTIKAMLWESICAVNRLISMMWSLPLATSKYSFPTRAVIDDRGQVISQTYLWNMVDNAHRILELDVDAASSSTHARAFSVAIEIDQQLRALAAKTPKSWWKVQWTELSVDAILQYWHCYLMARAHMPLALANDDQLYAFNFATCLSACQELAGRYLYLRKLLPLGFCANHVIDLQVFTATVFLLLTIRRGATTPLQPVSSEPKEDLVGQVLQVMESIPKGVGWNFAHHAANAIRSLRSILEHPHSQSQEPVKMSLKLPLVGRISVSRKDFVTERPPQQASSFQPDNLLQVQSGLTNLDTLPGLSDNNMTNQLAYSFEVLDGHSFFNDAVFDQDSWLNWVDGGVEP